jgi:hypothetical protein
MERSGDDAAGTRTADIIENAGEPTGSPALSMIQALQQDGGASICRDFAVGPGRDSAVIIENAGEP